MSISLRNLGSWCKAMALFLLCLGLSGCPPVSSSSDAGSLPENCYNPEPGSPVIRSFTFAGAIPQMPHVLRFAIDWEDANANLKGGSFQFTVDGEKRPLQILPDRFVSNNPSGAFSLSLVLSSSDFVEGRKVTVSFVLFDKGGLASNRPEMVLEVKQR
ncbi:MAG: hypothetical protein EP343_13190 [Deltaproteobacteria bacterium]|nr:MAG: hypothetical protein EP343_13190 [Deltaproteobacteria bacterium]